MPKVTRKETAADPLQAVAGGMEIEAGQEPLPPKPSFGALSAQDQAGNKIEFRRVSRGAARGRRRGRERVRVLARVRCALLLSLQTPAAEGLAHSQSANAKNCAYATRATAQIPVPQHRMTPLKAAWMQLYTPITDHLKLDMRMNLKTKKVRADRVCCTRARRPRDAGRAAGCCNEPAGQI